MDHSTSLEVPGCGSAEATELVPGTLFGSSGESPEITRYDLTEDGQFSTGQTLSFGNYGVAGPPGTGNVFVSDTKAYAVYIESAQLIVWNPTTMEVEDSIALAGLERPGYNVTYASSTVLRDDGLLLVPISWMSAEGRWLPESALLLVDTRTDEVEVVSEPRCGGLRAVSQAQTGEVFFSSTALNPVVKRHLYGAEGGSEPCLLRVLPGASVFDPEFLLRPEAFAEGALASDFAPSGNGFLTYLAVDEAVLPLADAEEKDLFGAAAWRLHAIDQSVLEGDLDAEQLAIDIPPTAPGADHFFVEGRVLVPQTNQDYTDGRLYDITDPRSPKSGLRTPGAPIGVFRLR